MSAIRTIDRPTRLPRRLRFSLRTLLALPLLFSVAWWYITWPERTSAKFAAALIARDLESAQEMCDQRASFDSFWKMAGSRRFQIGKPILAPPSWAERLRGERRFAIPWQTSSMCGDFRELIASHGRIRLQPANGGNLAIAYRIFNSNPKGFADALSSLYRDVPVANFSADADENSVVARVPDSAVEWVGNMIEELDRHTETNDSISIHLYNPDGLDPKILIERIKQALAPIALDPDPDYQRLKLFQEVLSR